MPDILSPITELNNIGKQRAAGFKRLGLLKIKDLLTYFPRAYEDRTKIALIADLQEGIPACFHAYVVTSPVLHRIRGRELVKFKIADDTGNLNVTFFNASYTKSAISKGDSLYFYGKLGSGRSLVNPIYEKSTDPPKKTRRIVPLYRLTSGLSQYTVSSAAETAVKLAKGNILPVLPEEIEKKEQLCDQFFAYKNVHFPESAEALSVARRRLIFEEFFVLAICLKRLRGDREYKVGNKMQGFDPEAFYSGLPFAPTAAQKKAIADAYSDLSSGRAMARLIQGDVGSGKTLVAAACILLAKQNGKQTAFMAPTEILAEQHERTLNNLLQKHNVKVGRLTGGMKAAERREVSEKLRNGEIDVCVGTHALISETTLFSSLGLAITDEQHRFGVAQRAALAKKTQSVHVLVMSATPIPRTLALIMYGDLDVSIIDEMPPGREPVITHTISSSLRLRLNKFIEKQVGEGRQVFVVCPMVEDNPELMPDIKSAEQHTQELKQRFPKLRIECMHGRMKQREKDEIMKKMAAGEIDILVSTTVVEVGIDIPNASLMIVENAERFGLSQLHQLRGRVGRGSHKSYCILVSEVEGQIAADRLKIMSKTNDGFKIAEEDLKIRGPGDFFGERQHGLPEMLIADPIEDTKLLYTAKSKAEEYLGQDPELIKPQSRGLNLRVAEIMEKTEGSLN